MTHASHTALVTGANSGLGFEAAAQLAEDGWGEVILACRSEEKAEAARARLVERTGKDPFRSLVIDTAEVDAAEEAVREVAARGQRIDFLLLNAGATATEATFTSAGVELTYASTLMGHHALTLGLLRRGLLAPGARIVYSGSESARDNMPGFAMHDLAALAAAHHGGDRAATIERLFRLELPEQTPFKNMNEYATAKLVGAWWVAALAEKLPAGITVHCVSPGANLSTAFARNAPAAMRLLMLPLMKLLGGAMGMNGPIADGARRYLDAFARPDDDSGHFYATAHPKKLVGPVGRQAESFPHFADAEGHAAAFAALERLTGVSFEAAVDAPEAATV